jgi:hypothetical protein
MLFITLSVYPFLPFDQNLFLAVVAEQQAALPPTFFAKFTESSKTTSQ